MQTMTRRDFLATLSAAALAVTAPGQTTSTGAAPAAVGAKRPPNIIYFIADELGYYELSGLGHPEFQTPNLDRLAAEGMRFTQYLAGSAVCAPVRCTLLTGKHAGHASVRDNGTHQCLQAGEPTLASMLKQAGYATGGFGKWGNGNRGSAGVPEKHGFDTFYGYYDQMHAHAYYPPYLIRDGKEEPLPGNKPGLALEGGTYSHYAIVKEAKAWIGAQKKERPFFAYLAWTPPHGSYAIPADDPSWALYKDKPWPQGAKVYAAMVNMIDRHFGEVMALLKETGVDGNTLIFFSGDNGGSGAFADAQHPGGFFAPNADPKTGRRFRAGKSSIYEGGLRIAAMARWPGRIKPGQVSGQLCYMPDIMPTLAEAAGAPCPRETDGISLLPALLGEAAAGHPQKQHEFLYWEFQRMTAVRIGNWKGVRPQKGGEWELYDLSADIEEKNDVAGDHPETIEKMKAIAEREHTPQKSGEVFDLELNLKDMKAAYPERTQGMGALPGEIGKELPPGKGKAKGKGKKKGGGKKAE